MLNALFSLGLHRAMDHVPEGMTELEYKLAPLGERQK
jgi:hypothetical protein